MDPQDINKYSMIQSLVVDDDTISRILHPRYLQRVGIVNHKVACSGKEAVDLVNSVGVEYFDVIFMDIDMPVMNGIEAAKKLRDMGVRNMIVGVSSHLPTDPSIVAAIESGIMDDYIVKPLNPEKIISVTKKIIECSS